VVKVILKNDDKVLGEKGEVVEVSDGYARNFLLPRKLVVIASDNNLKFYESIRKAQAKKLAKLKEDEKAVKDKIEAARVVIKVKAGSNKKLFGSITTEMIATALNAQVGIDLDKRRIIIPAPIKMTGKYTAQAKLKYKLVATVKLDIVPEEQEVDEEQSAE